MGDVPSPMESADKPLEYIACRTLPLDRFRRKDTPTGASSLPCQSFESGTGIASSMVESLIITRCCCCCCCCFCSCCCSCCFCCAEDTKAGTGAIDPFEVLLLAPPRWRWRSLSHLVSSAPRQRDSVTGGRTSGRYLAATESLMDSRLTSDGRLYSCACPGANGPRTGPDRANNAAPGGGDVVIVVVIIFVLETSSSQDPSRHECSRKTKDVPNRCW
mmetsp:Transcript_20748/g.57637  ORF Transcript_20748/g.57637 Transcript_20748/m.57637 type:complete len:217 (+) Transcript_20748:1550-2200(+)